MHKRTKIRIASYISALVLTLSVWGTVQTVRAVNYAKELTVAHQRTVAALSSYIDTLRNDLQKMQYANTSSMTSGLSISLCKASAGAKNCLSELGAGETPLNNINKFLTQASDYVDSLSKKTVAGDEISESDREQLTRLYQYASQLAGQLSYMEEVMLSGEIDFEDTVSTLSMLRDSGDLSLSYTDTVTDAEKSFSDYPTLIYDGPFADNIMTKESSLLSFQDEITQKEAKKRAAAYSGTAESKLLAAEDEKGTIEAYVFYHDNMTVAVTKKGGYLLYLLTDTFAGETQIKEEEAVGIADNFLLKIGFSHMEESYFFTSDGICTVNFAYNDENATCYGDLIKVSISLDKGTVVAADCTGYLMNHRQRTIPADIISTEKAMEAVSDVLTIKDVKKAFIPMQDGNEVFTYEFFCTDNNGNDVLVYINAVTGLEADIKLLLYSDGGTLTR